MSAQASLLPGNRLHLNHGPIDLIISADGDPPEVRRAYQMASAVFPNILPDLMAELAILRSPIGLCGGSPSPCLSPSGGEGTLLQGPGVKPLSPARERGWGEGGRGRDFARPCVCGPIARRMVEAVRPYRDVFITPMAAVAGAVAEHVLAAMTEAAELRRAIVNNGGDIAVHLADGERLRAGVVGDLSLPKMDATIEITSNDSVRGIATSGWRGRSQSLGIADTVTVLAATAATADAAATMIANAVNVDDPAVRRAPACDVRDDSDLGDLPVTVEVGALRVEQIALALENGMRRAMELRDRGLIVAAYLQLQGQVRVVGELQQVESSHAA